MIINRLIILPLVVGQTAQAHDYWLEPDNFIPTAGAKVNVRLFVGDHFSKEKERVFQKKRTVSFKWIAAGKTRDLINQTREDAKPIVQISPQRNGQHLITLQRDWAYIELEAKKFNGYLKHEGLENILKLRRKSRDDKAPGKERYRRYLKSLVQVGDQNDGTWKKRMGHRLEIIPLSNPYGLKPGDKLKALVLFEGKPLIGSQLEAYQRGAERVATQTLATDKAGQATIKMDSAGPWLLRLVHMRRCVEDPKYDWESFWAAYSFALP